MKIILITPALPSSRSGNRVTATRWKTMLTELGHKITVKASSDDISQICKKHDAMIALHAWRSAASIDYFKQQFPQKPLIVALTGTDLYKFINSHPKPTLRSIKQADVLITLHDLAYLVLPKSAHKKIHVVHQSAEFIKRKEKKNKRNFDVCVIGHLREEKDPLRAAYAVRKLPDDSRIRVIHYGKAHTSVWEEQAKKEMQNNLRYTWHGEVPHWKINKLYANADLMVLSSRMEGGANVVSEACAAGLPIVASDIDGSIGLLGKTYPGYYPCGNTRSLRELLIKTETDHLFLNKLTKACQAKASLFRYKNEKNSLKKIINCF
ncbi:MAG: TIGR04348 family glycosyltransferase [Gammaproteobacteria bacterium]|nr:MAG: TIGR04348 family glycosyltransferase [Gammaproteobacteria bacterium]